MLRTEGAGGRCPHSKNSKVSILFFYPTKIVCEPGMVADACNPITQETGKTLSKEKKK